MRLGWLALLLGLNRKTDASINNHFLLVMTSKIIVNKRSETRFVF